MKVWRMSDEAVTRLKVIEWEAAMLLANHDGIHNMHQGICGAFAAWIAWNCARVFTVSDCQLKSDFIIRELNKCNYVRRHLEA